jgi:uncharacterized membrane protein YdjX (TVP38/TMEM64 family)
VGYALGWHHYLTLEQLGRSREALSATVADHPLLAPAVFAALYAAAVAFAFPAASILTIFGGFLFGAAVGGVLVAFAATAGATALFLATQTAVGDSLRRRLGGRAERLAAGFEENAFGYLLALRLAPVFPFFLVNIAPALFKVPLRTFVSATFIGILPGAFVYAFLGSGFDTALAGAAQEGRAPVFADLVTGRVTLAFALLALFALAPAVARSFGFKAGPRGAMKTPKPIQ